MEKLRELNISFGLNLMFSVLEPVLYLSHAPAMEGNIDFHSEEHSCSTLDKVSCHSRLQLTGNEYDIC